MRIVVRHSAETPSLDDNDNMVMHGQTPIVVRGTVNQLVHRTRDDAAGDADIVVEDYDHNIAFRYCAWRDHATIFIHQLPDVGNDWKMLPISDIEVFNTVRKLTLWNVPIDQRVSWGWKRFINCCSLELAPWARNVELGILTFLVFMGVVQVALVDGLDPNDARSAIRGFLDATRIPDYPPLEDNTVDDIRESVLISLCLLDDVSKVIGPRAFEIPLRCPDILRLFQTCTPRCYRFIYKYLVSVTRPRNDDTMPCKWEVAYLVSCALGGAQSKWKYADVVDALKPSCFERLSGVSHDVLGVPVASIH